MPTEGNRGGRKLCAAAALALGLVWSAGAARAGTISGHVYDAASGDPVAGAEVRLVFDAEDGQSPGEPVPEQDLGPGQQGQVTGEDGIYRFDVPDGRRYRLVIDPSRTSLAFPSRRIPPRPGFAPGGEVEEGYYLRFAPSAGGPGEVRENAVPLDPARASVSLRKSADRPTASTGDLVGYTITAENRSARDFTSDEGRAVYIVDVPPRGFSLVRGGAIARVTRGGSELRTYRNVDELERGSKRILRFGPFDLPAGATLTLHYRATVTLDTRPGRFANRAVLADAAGVELTEEATAEVHVAPDPTLETSVVLGRVFCDEDGDGAKGPGERGLMGARVYIDSGSYAVTDSEGAYHLSRVKPGTHLVKVDEATLAGGSLRGPETRLLRLSEGLPARASFPVACASEVVTLDHPNASITHRKLGEGREGREREPSKPPRSVVTLTGELVLLDVEVDGRDVDIPTARATLVVPDSLRIGPKTGGEEGANLAEVPASGYGMERPTWNLSWSPPAGVEAERWTFVIERLFARGGREPFLTMSGEGAPPASLAWDGRGDAGQRAEAGSLYAARMTVIGDSRNAEAASAWTVFGVAYGLAGAQPVRETWRGKLFEGTAREPKPTADLEERVEAIAETIGEEDKVLVESHWNGTGDRLPTIARTQKEAALLADLLEAAGVDRGHIEARGRGSLEPLEEPDTAEARRKNRRVVVVVEPASGGAAEESVPATVKGKADVLIEGKSVEVDERGRFRSVVRVPERGAVLVDVRALDGRRAAIDVRPSGGAGRQGGDPEGAVAPLAREVAVEGDLAADSIRVEGAELPADLLRVDAELEGGPAVGIGGAGRRRALTRRLEFDLRVPAGVQVARWELVLREPGGPVVHRASGPGRTMPDVYTWDGTDESGLLLEPGKRYEYRLVVGAPGGSRGISPERTFTVAGDASFERMAAGGRLVTRGGKLSARLRRLLRRFATRTLGRPAEERYRVLLEARQADGGVEERIRAYLKRHRLDPDRYELAVRAAPNAPRDAVDIAAVTPSPPRRQPQVLVNGIARAIEGSRFEGSAEVPPGGAVVVDVTKPNGHRATFLAKARDPGSTPGLLSPGEAEPQPTPDLLVPESNPKADFGSARAAQIRVRLPPEGTVLRSRELAVTGTTDPKNRVTINGEEVHVRSDGRFSTVVELRPGESRLAVRTRDPSGYVSTIDWPVTVSEEELFALALGEGIISSSYTRRGWFGDTAFLPGMNRDTTAALGEALLHGRAVLYVKSRFSVGDVFDEVRLTAHVDTGKQRQTSAFFEQVVDPARGYPVFGDSAREVRDVNSRGKLYLRLEAGESAAYVGSLHTELEGGSLFRYDRTVDGGLVDLDHEVGAHQAQVKAFGSSEQAQTARDVNLFRATGGSLYYLRHDHVLEGSERVRVVVRDRDNGLVLAERSLSRNQDYTIDYPGGRVLLNEPLASSAASSWVVDGFESSVTPLEGNPVYLVVRYEHRDPDGLGQGAGGVYARDRIADRLSVGAGAVVEERPSGGDYSLWGADVRYDIGESSAVTAEVAGSRRRDAPTFLSPDGGLSFQDMHHVARTTGGGGRGLQLGWKATADIHLADVSGSAILSTTRVRLHGQKLDRGFSSGGTILEQGRLKLGGAVSTQLGEHDAVVVRHESEVAELPRVGPTAADVGAAADPMELDERATFLTSAQWAHDQGRWHHRVEAAHQRLSSTAALAPAPAGMETEEAIDARRLGLGARTAFDFTDRVTLRAGQQFVVNVGEADPRLRPIERSLSAQRDDDFPAGMTSSLGSDLHLAPGLQLSGDYFQRWDGASAAQIGLRSALSPTGSVYVHERFSTYAGRPVSTLVVGAEDRFGEQLGGRSYGEYQIENGVLGQRNRALLGLGHRWQIARGLRLGVGFEHQQTFGGFLPDGTPIGHIRRNVVHGAVDFVREDRLKASARVELRFDDGIDRDEPGGELVRRDPRSVADPGGFPDHGGTAPGAPLVLPPGDRVQLVAGLGADWKASPGGTLFGRLRLANTTLQDEELTEGETDDARWAELSLGWAYRPPERDWLHLLARYSYLLERRPLSLDPQRSDERSHVLAAVPLVELPWRLVLSGKLALKATEATDRPFGEEELETSADTLALLGLLRLGYRFLDSWDVTGEVRALGLDKPQGDERKHGYLFEVGYTIRDRARLAAGYNLSRFSDDELFDLERDSHGFFVRVTAHY